MAAIFLNGKNIWASNYPFDRPHVKFGNLVKINQAVSERKLFKDSTNLYLYIAQVQEQITHGNKILIVTKQFYYFYHTW